MGKISVELFLHLITKHTCHLKQCTASSTMTRFELLATCRDWLWGLEILDILDSSLIRAHVAWTREISGQRRPMLSCHPLCYSYHWFREV